MGTEGYGFVVELDKRAFNQLAVKSWEGAQSKLDKLPKTFVGTVPIKYGLEFYYSVNVSFPKLDPKYAEGATNQPIHATPYSEAKDELSAQLAIPVTIDLRAELRFPGELGKAREAGEFFHTVVNTVWLLTAHVGLADSNTPEERLIIDLRQVSIDHIDFLGVIPPNTIQKFINNFAEAFLPKLAATQSISVSPLYGSLTGVGMTGLRLFYQFKTLDSSGNDITGTLQGAPRFDSNLRTFLAAGLQFGFNGNSPPAPGQLPFQLQTQPDQTIALSVSQWALTFIRVQIVPKLIDDAVHQKIGDKGHRGLMAIDVDHGGQITASDDDGILVITDISSLTWDRSRFEVHVHAYVIQRGLFGWDDLAPDIQVEAIASFGIKPNEADFSKPAVDDIRIEFRRDESLWDVLTAPFTIFQKLVMVVGDVLTGSWEDAARNGMEVFANFPFLLTFVGFFVALFGGISLGDKGVIPSLKFSVGQEVVLEMRRKPLNLPGGDPFNGLTFFMTIR